MLGGACRQLVATAAAVLGVEPAELVPPIQTATDRAPDLLDERITDRLVASRLDLLRATYEQPHLADRVGPFDAALAVAGLRPCSTRPVPATIPDAVRR